MNMVSVAAPKETASVFMRIIQHRRISEDRCQISEGKCHQWAELVMGKARWWRWTAGRQRGD